MIPAPTLKPPSPPRPPAPLHLADSPAQVEGREVAVSGGGGHRVERILGWGFGGGPVPPGVTIIIFWLIHEGGSPAREQEPEPQPWQGQIINLLSLQEAPPAVISQTAQVRSEADPPPPAPAPLPLRSLCDPQAP